MAVYETMFLDFYAIQESTIRRDLLGGLRTLTDIKHEEMTDSELATLLWNAAIVFDPELASWDGIASSCLHGIELWAAMAVMDKQMMKSARYFPIDSRVGKTDPSVRVKNYVQIKKVLREQFDSWLSDSGITLGDTGVLVSEFHKRDMLTDEMVPGSTQLPPPRVTLQLLSKTTTSVKLQWTQPKMTDFYAFNVYYSNSPNIEDVTRKNQESNTGAREDADLAISITDLWDTAVEITELTAGATYWFAVGTEDYNNRVTFSNEIVVDLGN